MIISVCLSVINYFCLNYIITKIFHKNVYNKPLLILPLLLYAIFILISLYNTPLSNIYHILCFFATVFIVSKSYKIPKSNCLRTHIFLLLINVILSAPIINIFRITGIYAYILEIIINFFVFVFIVIISHTGLKQKVESTIIWLSNGIKNFLLVILSICVLCLILIFDKEYYYDYFDEWMVIISIMITLFTIITALAFPVMIISSSSNTYLRRLNEQYIKQIDFQTNHYKSMAKSNYELRKFRHDYKNTIIVLSKLLKENNTDMALELLDDSNIRMRNATIDLLPFETGNDIADALLKEKQALLKGKNIEIVFTGAISNERIKPNDICIILGNALDNAIEACLKGPTNITKLIEINSECSNGFMFLKVQNPVFEKVIIKNNIVSTNKTDRTLHGYGLASIRETISKYNGTLSLNCDDNIFTLEIDLSLNI